MIGVDGGMYALRKSLYEPLPGDTILDDFTVSMRVLRSGSRILYAPEAVAYENATESAMSEFRRRLRIGAGASQALSRQVYPRLFQPLRFWLFASHKLVRWLSPLVLMMGWMLVAFLAISDVRFMSLLIGAGAVVVLAAVGALSMRLRQLWLISVSFYFVMSQVAMGIGFTQGLVKRQNAMWEPTARSKAGAVQENAGSVDQEQEESCDR